MTRQPFADLPPRPAEHFKLCFYGAVLRVVDQAVRTFGSPEAAWQQLPFLAGYYDELAARGLGDRAGPAAAAWWRGALAAWETTVPAHLPLRALRQAAGLADDALTLLLGVGLIEEDPRFGLAFELLQGTPGQHRPTSGLLQVWGQEGAAPGAVRATLRRLLDLGLVQVANQAAPRTEWALQVPAVIWDAARGDTHEQPTPWARYQPPAALTPVPDLILPEATAQTVAALPALFASGQSQALVVRGPSHNGRHTVLGAVARGLGRGLLALAGLGGPEDERWRLVGPLATLLHALPVVDGEVAPGETAHVPRLAGLDGPLGVVVGRQGGVGGPGVEQALSISITLELPDPERRRRHWRASLGPRAGAPEDALVDGLRLTGGNIRRVALLARGCATLAGRSDVTLADAQRASRALNRQALDTLAAPVPTGGGDWAQLAVEPDTLRELRALERRCRHRERLAATVGSALSAQLNAGVRALLSGPSGTGKTLAARLLAAALEKDLYRLDLSTVVNKYIGETEKNLSQVFARAEELDVILLLDEGDALLTQRTSVQTSNDRYANLETNYLLQRLESFEGILLVTSNASHRIDDAFQRRMDVVIDFRPPDAAERWAIWQLHLPPSHAVPAGLLDEVARRCSLSGGQIRNAVLHGSLLGLDDGGTITAAHLAAAVEREYRKIGAVCPLRTAGRSG